MVHQGYVFIQSWGQLMDLLSVVIIDSLKLCWGALGWMLEKCSSFVGHWNRLSRAVASA